MDTRNKKTLKVRSVQITATLVLVGLYLVVYASRYVSEAELTKAAQQFHFERSALPKVPGPEIRKMRENAHPDLTHIAWYISSLGASVALNDLDNDALPNDLCYVDIRTDQVIIAPAPETKQRYKPFALNQAGVLDRERMGPMGCMPGDLNQDGLMDVLVYYAGRSPVAFLKISSDMAPSSYKEVEAFGEHVWTTSTATIADLDGDGNLDVIFGNYFQDGADIFNNESTGRVYMNDSFSRAQNGGGIHIFRWVGASSGENPQVEYIEVTDSALPQGVHGGWALALGAQDIDGDLLPEIYQADDHGPDHLFHNISSPGNVRFAVLVGRRGFNISESLVLGKDSFKSMGVDFGDINNDGLPDIYVSNVTDPIAFQESQFAFINTGETSLISEGTAPFVDESQALGLAQSGWCWDVKLADFNNDGNLEAIEACGFIAGHTERWAEYQELGAANDTLHKDPKYWPRLEYGDALSGDSVNPFFTRVNQRYEEIGGLIGFRESVPSRGIAIADVDGDGKLDMAVANMWADSTFYHNESPGDHAFLGLRLLLPLKKERAASQVYPGHAVLSEPVRYAIGAEVSFEMPDGRKMAQQVDGGNGHSGRRDANLLFGLGKYSSPIKVAIRWRDQFGSPQQETLELKPGWHTVVLGNSSDRSH